MSKHPLTDKAHQYAQDVVNGEIPACYWVEAACRRYLDDLADAEAGVSRWEFRADLSERALKFCTLLPNIKGPEAGNKITLMGWQCFAYANLFGWVERGTDTRRFRQGCVYVPRGNGKTTLAAPLALYLTFMDGEGGAEGYAAAVTRDQARILFDTAHAMAQRTPELKTRFGVDTSKHAVYQVRSASNFKAISSDAKALDGLNVQVAVCDEIGSHKTPEVYNVLLTAMGKRTNPMLLSISTATGNNSGIGKQLWDYSKKILEGSVEDDRFFCILYTIDEGDDIWDEATWRKANPSWGVSVQPEAIRSIASQARSTAAQEAAFQTRHLNVWVAAENQLFSMAGWKDCRVPGLTLEDFEGEPCFLGLDLSTKTDLAALSLVFPFQRETETGGVEDRVAVFGRAYLPDLAVREQRVAAYADWAKRGLLVVTPGDVTDFEKIELDILELTRRFNVQEVAYDPWSATMLAQRLQAEDVPMVEFKASTANFSEPTKQLDALIRSGCLEHNDEGPLTWCMSNVVGHYDARSNVYPKREHDTSKIDLAIATIMALGRSMYADGYGLIYDNAEDRPGGLLII